MSGFISVESISVESIYLVGLADTESVGTVAISKCCKTNINKVVCVTAYRFMSRSRLSTGSNFGPMPIRSSVALVLQSCTELF